MLQIIDDDEEQEPEKRPELLILELLLEYLIHEVSHGNNFEFIQALIRLFLKVLHFCDFAYAFQILILLDLELIGLMY